MPGLDGPVLDSLVRPVIVVIFKVLFDQVIEVAFAEAYEVIETLVLIERQSEPSQPCPFFVVSS